MLTQSFRERIALGTCVGSAALGALGIYQAWGSVPELAFDVATVWTMSANWLATRMAMRMHVGGCVLIVAGSAALLLR